MTKLVRSIGYGLESYGYFADIAWTNNESANHFVEVAISCPEGLGQGVAPIVTLTRGGNSVVGLELARFFARETFVEKNVTISVTVKTLTDSSPTATIQQQLLLSPPPLVVDPPYYTGSSQVGFPSNWTGVVDTEGANEILGDVTIVDLGSGRVAFTAALRRYFTLIQPDLIDGRFYRMTTRYESAKMPTLGKTPTGQDIYLKRVENVFQSIVFEYYRFGPAIPIIRSSLSVKTFIDTDFKYTIVANDSRSTFSVNLGTATGLVFDGTNTISGTFASPGTYNVGLVATNSFGTAAQTLSVEVEPFTAFGSTASVIRNLNTTIGLSATHRATWVINSGAPSGFLMNYDPPNFTAATGPERAFLTGTPSTAGSFNISLTATRVGFPEQTSNATLVLTVTDSLPVTTINANADILRNGIVAEIGQNISVALASVPSPASWEAQGLPPGVTIAQNGTITGAPIQEGTFFAAITARAAGREVSTAVNIRFEIRRPVVAPQTGTTAAARSPWLGAQWELTDLHVLARSRVVQSTLFESGALRLKLGDAINFAIFFVDQNSAVFALAPSQLRITIRRADNLDDLIIFKSGTPPATATTQSQTYYLLPVTTGNREREVAIEWAEDNGKNEPLQCVADIDWIKDGKTYSSRSFPVLLELDVTRP